MASTIPFPFSHARTRGNKTLTYVSDGDTNGVFYYIGTKKLRVSWTNPHTAGYVTVSRSTNIQGGPTDIVNRSWEYSTTDQNAGEWIKMDLGFGRNLIPSSYNLQNGSSASGQEIRNWKLQGSNDGSGWTDLDVRVSDTTMPSVNASWGHYTVTGVTTAYRYFRVLSTGVGAGGLLYLQVSEVELYGTLFS